MHPLLEQLENYYNQQSILLNYITRLKSKVHKPIADVLLEITSTKIPEKTKVMTAAARGVGAAKEAYAVARQAPSLQKIVNIKYEAEYIERILSDMVSPLRVMSKMLLIRSVVERVLLVPKSLFLMPITGLQPHWRGVVIKTTRVFR